MHLTCAYLIQRYLCFHQWSAWRCVFICTVVTLGQSSHGMYMCGRKLIHAVQALISWMSNVRACCNFSPFPPFGAVCRDTWTSVMFHRIASVADCRASSLIAWATYIVMVIFAWKPVPRCRGNRNLLPALENESEEMSFFVVAVLIWQAIFSCYSICFEAKLLTSELLCIELRYD